MNMQIFIPICFTFRQGHIHNGIKINIIISELVMPAKPDYLKQTKWY